MLFAQNINISSYSYIEISISFDIIIENAVDIINSLLILWIFFGLEIAIISAIDPLSKCSLSFGLLGLVLAYVI